MKEGRSAKYGRCLSSWVNFTIQSFPEEIRRDYKARFLEELKRYSFAKRKKGSHFNEGCAYELSGLEEVDIRNPGHLARIVKEGINLMYQKGTAKNVLGSLVSNLE